eukprot:gene6774-12767_t
MPRSSNKSSNIGPTRSHQQTSQRPPADITAATSGHHSGRQRTSQRPPADITAATNGQPAANQHSTSADSRHHTIGRPRRDHGSEDLQAA